VVELLKTKYLPTLLYCLDVCPASHRQLGYFNHVVTSCSRKISDGSTSKIAEKCSEMFKAETMHAALLNVSNSSVNV